MKKLNKKAFTIVELIVVIVIIGILAAILIPNVVKYIDQTKVIKDKELVSNLNKALAYDRLEKGIEIHETPTAALEAAQAHGYNVAVINKTSKDGNEILWDSVNDVYLYLEDGTKSYVPDFEPKKSVKDSQIWKISNTIDEQYATYYTGTETTVTVDKGFDAGESAVTSISLVRTASIEHDVVIRTNGGTLTINAKNDEVIHYGYADSVNVIDVATASYHENGEVKFLEVAAGHIVLEADAEVSAVHFTATNGEFKNSENKTISIDLSKVSEDKMPSFSRDAVTIEENGTYVAEVKTDSTEYIWLFGNGIKEQMVVTESTGAIAENGTLKAGITAGAEDGSVAEQIANPAKRNDAGQLLDANDEVVTDPQQAVVEELPSKEDVQAGATLFGGGSGTKNDPWYIIDQETFQHVGSFYDENDSSKFYYWKVRDDITEIDMTGWTSINLQGKIEGNNVTLKNLTAPLFMEGAYTDATITIENMKIEANIVKPGGWVGVVFNWQPGKNVLIDNIDVSGYVEGNAIATYMNQVYYDLNATIKNSESSITMFGAEACGGMTGYIGMSSANVTLNVVNSKYSGTMIRSANSNFTYFGFNNNSAAHLTLTLDAESANAYFTIKGNAPEATTYTGTWAQLGNAQTVYTNESKKVVGSLTISVENNKFVAAQGSSTRAVATLMVGPNPGNMYAGYYTEELTLVGSNWVSEKLALMNITCDNSKPVGFASDGQSFNVHGDDGNIHIANILVTEYDSQGNVINVGKYTIPASYYPDGKAY